MNEEKMITKAKINLREGLIELEGTEEFVQKNLDLFKEKMKLTEERPLSKEIPKEIPKKNMQKKKGKQKKRLPEKISIEEFDSDSKNGKGLVDFFKGKNPKTERDKIVTIAYYICKIKGLEEFSDGNIDYGYKVLSMSRPGFLRQIIINQKNEGWFAQGSTKNRWTLERLGELRVEKGFSEEKTEK